MILMARAIKWQAAAIIQPIIYSQNHATSYLWPGGWIHTHIRTHILWWKESDFMKPGVHRPVAGAPGLKIHRVGQDCC